MRVVSSVRGMKLHSFLSFALAAGVCAAHSAHAATIIDYNGDSLTLVDASTPFQSPAPAVASGTINTRAFGSGQPLTGYTGVPFSVGYEATASAASVLTFSRQQIRDNSDGGTAYDRLTIQNFSTIANTTTLSFAAVVVFPTTTFSLETLTAIGDMNASNSSFNSVSRAIRWVVQTGGAYYINTVNLNNTTLGSTTGITQTRGSTLTDSWIAYSPSTAINANLSVGATALGSALDSVTAVGLYVENDSFVGSGALSSQMTFGLSDFRAATVIPEPGSAALLTGAMVIGLAAVRRRSRS